MIDSPINDLFLEDIFVVGHKLEIVDDTLQLFKSHLRLGRVFELIVMDSHELSERDPLVVDLGR